MNNKDKIRKLLKKLSTVHTCGTGTVRYLMLYKMYQLHEEIHVHELRKNQVYC